MKGSATGGELVIRDLTEVAEMRAVEELQREVWGMSDRDVVSVFMLRATGAVGGVLLGAFDAGELVGFAYGFVGLERGRPLLHSDMLAVRAAYRGRGLGFRLKLAQRERALAAGLPVMTWTFDPLQAANARLNFGKLGAVSDRYLVNFYGEQSSSPLHTSGTDRLWLTWPLDSRRVGERVARPGGFDDARAPEGAPALLSVGDDSSPAVADFRSCAREQLLVEVPADFGRMQRDDPARARAWREATRRAFTEALGAGYLVEEFFRLERGGRPFGAYLLTAGRKLEEFL